MHGDPMQGQPGASKMLAEPMKNYYVLNMAEKVQEFVKNCHDCIKAKLVKPNTVKPHLNRSMSPAMAQKISYKKTWWMSYRNLMGTH